MHIKKSMFFILVCALCFSVLAGCNNDGCNKTAHVCEHVCPVCLKCTDESCDDPVCADKCECENEKPIEIVKNIATMRVSVGGNSEEIIFDSFEQAVVKAESIISESTARVDIEIELSEGTHVLSDVLYIGGENFEGKNYSLNIKGAGAEDTIVSSAISINSEDLEDYGNGQYSYQLPESYIQDGKYPSIHDFYVNGKVIGMAKSDKYVMSYDPVKTDSDGEPVTEEQKKLYLDSRLFTGMASEDVKGTELWIENVWNLFCVHLEGFDSSDTKSGSDGAILYAAKVRSYDWDVLTSVGYASDTLAGNAYYIQNSEYYLDETQPDTFVYDREEGKFFIQLDASADVEQVELSFPMLNTLISLENVKNVTITDICFSDTTNTFVMDNHYVSGQAGSISVVTGEYYIGFLPYAAIFGNNVSDLTIKNCLFDGLGTDGVNFRGAVDRVSVTDNAFTDIGGTAVRFADNSENSNDRFYDEYDHYCDITISENYINGTGRSYKSCPAVQIGHVKNLTLTNNTILHSSYSAISVGWGWRAISDEAINVYNAEIAYNYIEGFMESLADGGAIYAVGGNASFEWKDTFNNIHDNYCVVSEDTKTNNFTVLYLDGSSTNWAVDNNVILTVTGEKPKMNFINFQSISSQQVFNCTAENNYVVGITDYSAIFGQGLASGDLYGLYAEGNVAVKDYEELVKNYSDAVTIIEASGCKNHRGFGDGN